MKLPAVWMAAAFAAGIVAGRQAGVLPGVWMAACASALFAAFFALRRSWLHASWTLALLAWIALGALAFSLEARAIPADHVAALVDSGRLDTSEPLRWRGRLRSDPVRLPWGARYETELEHVEVAGALRPVTGGLRANYFFDDRKAEALPALRAGDNIELLLRARPPRNFRNPGAFDARTNLARQGVHLVGTLRSLELLQKTEERPPTLAHRFARARGFLLGRIDALFGARPEHAAVLRAMLLGDFHFVERDVSDAFQKTAVYHVLVISGMHIVALTAFVWWMARRLRVPRPLTVALVLIVLLLFVGVVEDRPPIARAVWMAGVTLAAQLLYRRVELLNSIAVAAAVLLALQPSSLFDPSFQLSFLAAGMIAGVALPLAERSTEPYRRALAHLHDVTRDAAHPPRAAQWRLDLRTAGDWLAGRLPQGWRRRATGLLTGPCACVFWLWDGFLISLVVQFGMMPVMAHYFHRVSLSGPLANLPAGVLSALIVPVGFFALLAGSVSSALGAALAGLVSLLTWLLLSCVNALAGWTAGAYRVPSPPAWALAGFYLLLAAMMLWLASENKSRWRWAVAAAIGVLAVVSATHPFAPDLAGGKLEVTVLDVGQGDSIFVAFPGGRTLLIDGGGSYGASRVGGARTGLDVGEQVVSAYLWQRGIERLDAVALTHAHNDHLDGLHTVLENFRVRELWFGRQVDSAAFRALLERARSRGTQWKQLRAGDSFDWDGATGLVLWPENASPARTAENNDSLVLRIEYAGRAALLTGDIERPVEEALVSRGLPLDARFLKVAHHGSRSSTTAPLLRAIAPLAAGASFAEGNPFGYPHPEVVARLCALRARFLRTDRDGAITALIGRDSFRIRSYAQEAGLPGREATPCPAVAAPPDVIPAGDETAVRGKAKKSSQGKTTRKNAPGKPRRR